MAPDAWYVVTTGIVILIAIATSNRSIRRDASESTAQLRRDTNESIAELRREMGERFDGLSERVNRMGEQLGDVRERLGRVEGLLGRAGLTGREQAGKGRGDEQAPALPQP